MQTFCLVVKIFVPYLIDLVLIYILRWSLECNNVYYIQTSIKIAFAQSLKILLILGTKQRNETTAI